MGKADALSSMSHFLGRATFPDNRCAWFSDGTPSTAKSVATFGRSTTDDAVYTGGITADVCTVCSERSVGVTAAVCTVCSERSGGVTAAVCTVCSERSGVVTAAVRTVCSERSGGVTAAVRTV
ncbi:MAG: hypothetical protein IJJ33_03315, partial [Victivallales bacterium]|nr:hypothetical protein [Victivallales bacterium]